jgi:hypothetical protein
MIILKNFTLWTTPNLANWPFGLRYGPGKFNLNLTFFDQSEGCISLPPIIAISTIFVIFRNI